MHTIMPVIDYILDLAAAGFAMGCGAMWMALKYRAPSSGQEADLFIARIARGQSYVTACSLVGFIATGIIKVSLGMRPGVVGELALLLSVCAGLFIWFGLRRLMRKLNLGRR
jgi:hypothetical protein